MSENAETLSNATDTTEEIDEELRKAQENLEQLKDEEEARKRRIALRRQAGQDLPRRKQDNFWVMPVVCGVLLVTVFLVVAWYWPAVQASLE